MRLRSESREYADHSYVVHFCSKYMTWYPTRPFNEKHSHIFLHYFLRPKECLYRVFHLKTFNIRIILAQKLCIFGKKRNYKMAIISRKKSQCHQQNLREINCFLVINSWRIALSFVFTKFPFKSVKNAERTIFPWNQKSHNAAKEVWLDSSNIYVNS